MCARNLLLDKFIEVYRDILFKILVIVVEITIYTLVNIIDKEIVIIIIKMMISLVVRRNISYR